MKSNFILITLAIFLTAEQCHSVFHTLLGNIPREFQVGDYCESNAVCKANLGDLTECVEEKCSCISNYAVPSEDSQKCLPVINFIGGDCQEPQQCTSGTPGSYSDCLPSTIVPDIKICNCTDEAVNQPGRHTCYKKANLVGESCEMDFQCTAVLGELSECTENKTCACQNGSVANMEGAIPNSKCLKGGILINSGGCTDMAQCVGIPGVNSACSTNSITYGKCFCLGAHIARSNYTNCLPIRNKVGESCETKDQCTMGSLGQYGYCSTREGCQCQGVHEEEGHVCFPSVTRLTGSCRINEQCQAGLGKSQCVDFRCECLRNATVIGLRCA